MKQTDLIASGSGSFTPKNPLLIVPSPADAEAARKIVGEKYEVESLDNGALPELQRVTGREVILWGEAAHFKNENDLTEFIGTLYVARARKVTGIGGPDIPPLTALNGGADLTAFETFLQANRIDHPKFTPQLLVEDDADEDFIPPQENEVQAWHDLGLRLTEKGSAVPNLENVVRVLEGMPQFRERIWLDEFVGDVFTSFGCAGTGAAGKRQWLDSDTLALQLALQRNLGMARIGQEAVHQGVMAFAHANRRNPPKEWLRELRWDGNKRIGGFFRDYMGAEDSEYIRAVSRNFFLALVARVFQPGCKVDNMVVLEGSQGRRKSTALKKLGGEWFTECNEPLGAGSNKDFYSILRGKMLVEIAELDSFRKADVARIKTIITTATDRYRPPYGKVAQEVPRTSVFVGTTNEDAYLADSTGGRRFWPVRTGEIDADKIEEDREQLFAEAVSAYQAKPVWWELPHEEARAHQEARRRADAWEDILEKWLADPPQAQKVLTSALILEDGLSFPASRITHSDMIRLAACMKALGYTNHSPSKIEGRSVKVWRKNDKR